MFAKQIKNSKKATLTNQQLQLAKALPKVQDQLADRADKDWKYSLMSYYTFLEKINTIF